MVSVASIGSMIDAELRWREPELAIAKRHVQLNLSRPVNFRASYRSFVAMTYAHYEGFTKLVIAQAMEEIERSGTKKEDCNEIYTKAMLPLVRKSLDKSSNADLWLAIQSGPKYLSTIAAPRPETVLECGNLDVATFGWAMSLIGIDPNVFAGSRSAIGRITTLRHKCAHGETLTLDPLKTDQDLAEDIFELQRSVQFLMYGVAVNVLEHLETDGFRI